MRLNYSPEEVSFVLIDYKGGSPVGAFENKLTGLKLSYLRIRLLDCSWNEYA